LALCWDESPVMATAVTIINPVIAVIRSMNSLVLKDRFDSIGTFHREAMFK
jgi:hypothetical protein